MLAAGQRSLGLKIYVNMVTTDLLAFYSLMINDVKEDEKCCHLQLLNNSIIVSRTMYVKQ